MKLPKLHIDKEYFKDEYGRTVILRGVNLGGDCKVPYPNGGTEFPSDFSDHRDVSFIGRPFPLEDAYEHFSRLKEWGFNCLRLLTTWEAVEHKGPFEYDEAYLDYFAKICELAGDYGFYIFVDFHQDVWSRMTGGDGAPGWLFEKVGIDYTQLGNAEAAHVMQNLFDYANPTPRQPEKYPQMSWSSNLSYPANGIMWTLFFGGRDFAPNMRIDGQNVQDFLQLHYIKCVEEVAKRVSHLTNMLGFDSLNEPSEGWIGHVLDSRLQQDNDVPKALGKIWEPIQALYSTHGNSVKLPVQRVNLLKGGIVADSEYLANSKKQSIWFDGCSDPFQSAGAWKIDEKGHYEILNNNFFRIQENKVVDFSADYLFPFIHNVSQAIRTYNPEWIVFAEKPPGASRDFPPNPPSNIVNASHWYDIVTLGTKRFNYPITLDFHEKRLVIGAKNIQRVYERHLSAIKEASRSVNLGCPSLIGEFGIPFDLEGGKAYDAWKNGNRSPKIWKKHILALDLMYNALDKLKLNATQWNYTAHNRNDLRIGDCWNQEDLSIYSVDQRVNTADIDSGGRALEGFVRPYPHFIQGELSEFSFNRKKKKFQMRYLSNPTIEQPTVIFVPRLQFTNDYKVEVQEGEVIRDTQNQLVVIRHESKQEICITISI